MTTVSVSEGALSRDPSILAAAEFAVNDHNKKNPYPPVKLLTVDKAASQLSPSGGSTVYYLSLNIQSTDSNWENPPPFTTAVVCVPPSMKPSISVGFVDLEAYLMNDDDSDEADMHKVEHKVESFDSQSSRKVAAAEICMKNHNANNPDNFLQLEEVWSCVCSAGDDGTHFYSLILQVSDGQRSQLVKTLAMRSNRWGDDEWFDCTPLLNLLHMPYPEWISLELIEHVTRLGLEHYLLLPAEDESSPDIFFKSADHIYKLPEIATQLGPRTTREQLLPFLGEDIAYVDPHVLNLMAQQFGSLIPHLGGVEHAYLLLPPLISLSLALPHALRGSALQSFSQIALHTNDTVFSSFFIPFVVEMARSDSHLCRASSCAFFGLAYRHATRAMKSKLIKVYKKLSRDDFPSVRGSVASSLAEITTNVRSDSPWHLDENDDCYIEAEHICQTLAEDDYKCVRLLAAKACRSLLRLRIDVMTPRLDLMRPRTDVILLYNAIIGLSRDPCLEVLILTPSLLYEFCVANGLENTSNMVDDIIFIMEHLFYHVETSVREEVAKALVRLCRFLGRKAPLRSFLPFVERMSSDSSKDVSAVSAWLLMHLFSSCREEDLSGTVVPIFIELLKGDCIAVKLNIIIRLDHVWDQAFIDLELRKLLIATVNELAESRSTMTRTVILVYSPMLATLFGIDKFRKLCLQKVKNQFPLVSKAARKSLKFFAENEKKGSMSKERILSVEDLCFPQDWSQLTNYVYEG